MFCKIFGHKWESSKLQDWMKDGTNFICKRCGKKAKSLTPDYECNCDGAKFVRHIKEHLHEEQEVICKICEMSVAEIATTKP